MLNPNGPEHPIAPVFHVSVNNIQSRKDLNLAGNKLMEFHPQPIVLLDSEGYIIQINTAFQTLLGFTPAELCGSDFLQWVVEEDQNKTAKAIGKTDPGRKMTVFDNSCYREDRSLVAIKWSLQWDLAENICYCFGEDIS